MNSLVSDRRGFSGASQLLHKLALLPAFVWLLSMHSSYAGSATWNINPPTNDWNTAVNWTPNTVPNGPSDVATFSLSNATSVAFSTDVEVSEIVFNSGSSHFTIDSLSSAMLTISGAGITNISGSMQQFVVDQNDCCAEQGEIRFTNSATAGLNTTLIAMPGETYLYGSGGSIAFEGQSSADQSVIHVYGAARDAFFGGELTFYDNSSAGNATISTSGTPGGDVGAITFVGASTAGNATINNGRIGPTGGFFYFWATANAGTSQITNNGYMVFRDSASLNEATIGNVPNSTNGYYTGSVNFWNDATADMGTIINQGGTAVGMNGAATHFTASSTAGSATLIAQAGSNGGGGGVIYFEGGSDGGQGRVEIYGNGALDISPHDPEGVTIGSLEGDGLVLLGANALTIGTNNLDTSFSGLISDIDHGALVKTGTGKLTISGVNTYTGGTTINGGTLYVATRGGSATGTGDVLINAGKLGGIGRIAGNVVVGDGRAPEAYLTPGIRASRPATLTLRKSLTFSADGTFHFGYRGDGTADKAIARGITINPGAELFFGPIDNGTINVGTVFTVLQNTASTAIAGVFANIVDGGIVSVGNNTFQANYEGGDGNDLTLTVIP